jgi:hypothetical protein
MSLRKIAMQKELTGNNPQQILFAEKITTIKTLYPSASKREKIEDKFKNLIHEELKLGSVVSYVGNKNVPFLRIYRYKEAFAFDFVMDFLRRFEANSDDYVLDPFSGLGTTMFTSLICGITSVGIDKLPIAYFIDMQKVITEWFKVLATDAKVAMVIDNVRFEGELIPVDLVLSEMSEEAGFGVKEIIVARYKGNSSQQMKKYGRVPVRESIVVWEK